MRTVEKELTAIVSGLILGDVESKLNKTWMLSNVDDKELDMKSSLSIAALALLLAASCGNTAENNENNVANNTSGTNNPTGNNTTGNNTTGNNTTGNNTTGNNTTGAVSFSADVVPIIADSCALAGCHLDPGNGTSFVVGADADAAAVQAALEGVETGAGRALVVGGDIDNSELWLRVSGTMGARMPFGGELPPAEIATITAWIEAGAAYD